MEWEDWGVRTDAGKRSYLKVGEGEDTKKPEGGKKVGAGTRVKRVESKWEKTRVDHL